MAGRPVTGGYGCVDIGGWFGWNIKALTHSRYDHAFVILSARLGIILEAQPAGARISYLSKYDGLPQVYSSDAVPEQDIKNLTVAAKKFVGIPYGWPDIAYLGISLATPFKPGWLFRHVLREDRMICSQLVAAFGRQYGVDWNCGESYAQLVTPGMLAARA